MKVISKLYFVILFVLLYIQVLYPQAGFKTGKIEIRVNEFGNIQLWAPLGLQNLLNVYRTSILVGVSPDRVFDYYNDSQNQDTVKLDTLGGNFRIYGSFNNHFSNFPPEFLIKLEVFGWKNASYALLKFNIRNKDTLTINAITGLEIVPQITGTPESDTVRYLQDSGIADILQGSHVGYKLLSNQLSSLKAFEYYDGYEIDSNFYSWLTHGMIDTFFTSNVADTTIDNGAVIITSQAPVTLVPDDSIIVYYALAFGNNLNEMISNINDAESKYIVITSVNGEKPVIANHVELYQNYPNPFNPSTNIEFHLPQNLHLVELKVYDILGREISTIVSDYLPGGHYKYRWNGSGLSSGIYFYKLTAGSLTQTKKMILLR
ncbi:MAG: T9SS type A sorting domain-containing protein [Ignavibacteria bacterium]